MIAQLTNGLYVVLIKFEDKDDKELVYLWNPAKAKAEVEQLPKEKFLNVLYVLYVLF